jgi:uncharacterized protein (DUF433 family)
MTAETSTAGAAQDIEAYQHLEHRPGSWRRQLYLKGRNIAVGQLIYSMRADRLSPEQAVREYGLTMEQVQEALEYYRRHRDVIQQDAEDERRYLESKGMTIDPPAVPR